jgi:hypothetical protein
VAQGRCVESLGFAHQGGGKHPADAVPNLIGLGHDQDFLAKVVDAVGRAKDVALRVLELCEERVGAVQVRHDVVRIDEVGQTSILGERLSEQGVGHHSVAVVLGAVVDLVVLLDGIPELLLELCSRRVEFGRQRAQVRLARAGDM